MLEIDGKSLYLDDIMLYFSHKLMKIALCGTKSSGNDIPSRLIGASYASYASYISYQRGPDEGNDPV
jgi:hypothetical protein